ncbi:hypothetical protein ABID97_005455 [Variovorax sp. OAS795]|uniref:DUF695 domain-containing protein n=1 Tax=Variovorax sp. OAS795 TaxID=3034231 RepID=UPI0033969B42
MTKSSSSGVIVETKKDGFRILWTFVPEMPSEEERLHSPVLAVLSWRYDRFANGGMPETALNEEMLMLEDVLGEIESPGFCFEAYRRIGDGLREFVLYISDQAEFMAELNERLREHSRYPIEISFYRDETWSDLQRLIDDLGPA